MWFRASPSGHELAVLAVGDVDGLEGRLSGREDVESMERESTGVRDHGVGAVNAIATRRTTCRSCACGPLEPVLSLGNQFLVRFVQQANLGLPRAPLNLTRCDACGLLQLEHTVSPDLLYREFWYRSSVNDSMRSALQDVVRTGLTYHHYGAWLDIGANDGFLLKKVPPNFTKIAVEPAKNFEQELGEVSDYVIADYFTAAGVDGVGMREKCDVVTSCAMFYDLDDPNRFVADIAAVLSPNGIWINQLNDAPTMLRQNAFDAICHEHLCYYDLFTLKALYERHGLVILGITYNDVNGGSVRVVAEKPSRATRSISLAGHGQVTRDSALAFAARTSKWKDRMTELIAEAAHPSRGPIWCYGASTKGCALLQYLDLNEAFTAIADRNPLKHGLVMSGSWLPIRTEEEMRQERPGYLLALPWAFRSEFVQRERDLLDAGTTMIFPLPNIELVL